VPELISNHYKNFIQLSNKTKVQEYMEKFVNSIAYVGHTESVDMEQLTQVIRRICKTPENMGSDFLLNFLITLAIGSARFNEYDEKSKKFVNTCLDYVEEKFAGTHKFEITVEP
jgi:hypothetical protein